MRKGTFEMFSRPGEFKKNRTVAVKNEHVSDTEDEDGNLSETEIPETRLGDEKSHTLKPEEHNDDEEEDDEPIYKLRRSVDLFSVKWVDNIPTEQMFESKPKEKNKKKSETPVTTITTSLTLGV